MRSTLEMLHWIGMHLNTLFRQWGLQPEGWSKEVKSKLFHEGGRLSYTRLVSGNGGEVMCMDKLAYCDVYQ